MSRNLVPNYGDESDYHFEGELYLLLKFKLIWAPHRVINVTNPLEVQHKIEI